MSCTLACPICHNSTSLICREPRAFLFLNRFTRKATIMLAAGGIEHVFGLDRNQIRNTSFYEHVTANYLMPVMRGLERAKSDNSIIYLRFCCLIPGRRRPTDDTDKVALVAGGEGLGREGFYSRQPCSKIGTACGCRPILGSCSPRLSKPDVVEACPYPDGEPILSTSRSYIPITETLSHGEIGHKLHGCRQSCMVEGFVRCTSDGLIVTLRRVHSHFSSWVCLTS